MRHRATYRAARNPFKRPRSQHFAMSMVTAVLVGMLIAGAIWLGVQ